MEKFNARKVTKELIELQKSDDLESLCNLIDKEENFILEWKEGDFKKSQLFFGGSLLSKVRNGDLNLTSRSPHP